MSRARIIAVVGASGGVGASTFTTALAVAASERDDLPVVCIDGHPLGGGLDVVLGVEHERGVRWPDLARARGSLDGDALVGELPRAGDVSVVSFGRGQVCHVAPDVAADVLRSVAECAGVVVLDVPVPGRGGLSDLIEFADDSVLVCGSGPPALAAAATAVQAIEGSGDRWWLAQRGERSSADLAEAVSLALELPLLEIVPDDPRVSVDLSRGHVPGARARGRLGGAARSAFDTLMLQNLRTVRTL